MSTLNEIETLDPPAVDQPTLDILFGRTDCFGGRGAFASAAA